MDFIPKALEIVSDKSWVEMHPVKPVGHIRDSGVAQIEQFEKESNLKIPHAVRAWYELPGAVSLLARVGVMLFYADEFEISAECDTRYINFATDDVSAGMWSYEIGDQCDPRVFYCDVEETCKRVEVVNSFSKFILCALGDDSTGDTKLYGEFKPN